MAYYQSETPSAHKKGSERDRDNFAHSITGAREETYEDNFAHYPRAHGHRNSCRWRFLFDCKRKIGAIHMYVSDVQIPLALVKTSVHCLHESFESWPGSDPGQAGDNWRELVPILARDDEIAQTKFFA